MGADLGNRPRGRTSSHRAMQLRARSSRMSEGNARASASMLPAVGDGSSSNDVTPLWANSTSSRCAINEASWTNCQGHNTTA